MQNIENMYLRGTKLVHVGVVAPLAFVECKKRLQLAAGTNGAITKPSSIVSDRASGLGKRLLAGNRRCRDTEIITSNHLNSGVLASIDLKPSAHVPTALLEVHAVVREPAVQFTPEGLTSGWCSTGADTATHKRAQKWKT